MSDQIVRYTTTVADRVERYCFGCAKPQSSWVGETEGGDILTCCCVCQRVLHRRPKGDGAAER